MRRHGRMRDDDVTRCQGRCQLPDHIQKSIVVRYENLNVVAHLGQLGRRAYEIRDRSRVSVPDKDVKTQTTQIVGNPASDNAESDYTDIFLGSTRHWRLNGLFAAWPPVQPEAKTATVQSRSSLRPRLKRPQILGLRAKIDNHLLHRPCPFLICQVDRDIAADFVECLLSCRLDIDRFENVKAKPRPDRLADLARMQFERRLNKIRRHSSR